MTSTDHLRGAARAFALTYLLMQGLGILMFWFLLWQAPPVRTWFVMSGSSPATFLSLALADGLFLPATSLTAGWALWRRRPWHIPALWLHAGAAAYAGLAAVGMWIFDDRLWLGAGLMIPVLITPLVIAITVTRGVERIGHSSGAVVLRTLGQIVVFWSFFLGFIPAALLLAQEVWGLSSWPTGLGVVRALAAAVFAGGSLLGLASAWHLATRGRGTPLPLDPTRHLVTTGPYAWVRNPMAVGGLTQSLGVALWCGSPLLMIYTACGVIAWEMIRPAEERELRQQFGVSYERYRDQVPRWVPRLRPYRPTTS